MGSIARAMLSRPPRAEQARPACSEVFRKERRERGAFMVDLWDEVAAIRDSNAGRAAGRVQLGIIGRRPQVCARTGESVAKGQMPLCLTQRRQRAHRTYRAQEMLAAFAPF